MIEFGRTLRVARETKGYTVSQLAEMTHLKSSVVEGLENEDFSMIAAPIYGRGFVKLYCEAVGLEPKPLVDEFMAIVNGEREIAIKERPVAETQEAETPPPQPLTPEPPPAPTPAPASEEPDLFRQDPVSQPPAPTPAPAETEPAFSRFAAPMREYSTTPSAFPLNPRIIVLAVAGLALLAGLVFGIRALYCATSSSPSGDTTEASTPVAAVEASPRTPQDIPSLYID